MKYSKQNQSILQINHQRGHHVQLVFVLLVKMQIELASHLKDKGVKIVKKPLNVEQYIKELKQNCQNTGHVP